MVVIIIGVMQIALIGAASNALCKPRGFGASFGRAASHALCKLGSEKSRWDIQGSY